MQGLQVLCKSFNLIRPGSTVDLGLAEKYGCIVTHGIQLWETSVPEYAQRKADIISIQGSEIPTS